MEHQDSPTPPQPATRQRYSTTDARAAHDFLTAAYQGIGMNIQIADHRSPGFRLASSAAVVGEIGLSRVVYTGRVRAQLHPSTDLLVGTLLRGRYRVSWHRGGRSEYHELHPGSPFLWVPDQASEADYTGDATAVVVPRSLIDEVAAARSGVDAVTLRFDGVEPVSPALQRYWKATVSYVERSVLSDPALAANPMVTGPAQRLLAAAALVTFPNTTMTLDGAPAGRVAPAVVRRAQAYAEAHPDRYVSVADMAAAAGVGVRSLQHAFARHLSTTPTAYSRRVRLQHAHQDLRAADAAAGDRVATIAARWGFANPSRFATDYRAVYGQTPDETLRR